MVYYKAEMQSVMKKYPGHRNITRAVKKLGSKFGDKIKAILAKEEKCYTKALTDYVSLQVNGMKLFTSELTQDLEYEQLKEDHKKFKEDVQTILDSCNQLTSVMKKQNVQSCKGKPYLQN